MTKRRKLGKTIPKINHVVEFSSRRPTLALITFKVIAGGDTQFP